MSGGLIDGCLPFHTPLLPYGITTSVCLCPGQGQLCGQRASVDACSAPYGCMDTPTGPPTDMPWAMAPSIMRTVSSSDTKETSGVMSMSDSVSSPAPPQEAVATRAVRW